MASPPKEQKTAILQDAPPEVAQARSQQPPPSSAATMMLDAQQHAVPGGTPQRQMVVPTMMRDRPSGQLAPVPKPQRESTIGRWIAGPIISLIVAAGTAALAHVIMPPKGKNVPVPGKPQGHVRLQTDPPGATVTVNGVNWSHFTPTVIDGDINSTVHIGFKLDGYQPNDTNILVLEGEHTVTVKLEAAPKQAPPPPTDTTTSKEHEHHHHGSTAKPGKEETGEGMITIRVRPWAIVYVDGSRLRQTPVTDFKLKAGKHTIELVNEGKNRREKIPLQVKAGDSTNIERDWDK